MGYGYARYTSNKSAEEAVSALDGYSFGGEPFLRVKHTRNSNDEILECKLHVSRIPITWTEKDVLNAFGEVGY